MPWSKFVFLCVVFLWIREVTCEKDRNACIFHYWQVDWKTAVRTCKEDNMELLCYRSEKEINDITEVFNLGAKGSAKLIFWLASSGCSSDNELEECLSLHIKKTDGQTWHYNQYSCDELYPFICCVNDSAEFTTPIEYITSPANMTSDVFDITDSSLLTTTHKASSIPSEFCKSISKRGMLWPDTSVGKIATLPCPGDSTGMSKWMCEYGTNGNWKRGGPDLTKCRSKKIQSLKERFNSTSASNLISHLEELFNDSKQHVFAADLVDLLSLMLELPDRLFLEMDSFPILDKWNSTSNNMNKVAKVVDHIMELGDTWKDIEENERSTVGTHLLSTMDGMGSLLAHSMPEKVNEHSMHGRNMALQVLRPQLGESVSLPQWEPTNSYGHRGRVTLQEGYDNQLVKDRGNIALVYAVYTSMSTILSPTQEEEEKEFSSSLNSAVVSVTVTQGRQPAKINNEIQILVEHLTQNPNNSACVFWNMNLDDWDTTGCRLENSNGTYSVCICNHLTNFALLMDYRDVLGEVDQDALNYITLVGCSLSIVCLAVCVVIFSCYSYHSRHSWALRYVIHRNLCLTLLIANLVLIVGLDKTDNRRLCAIIAGLLHYFFLSAFSWMFLEAVHIYLLLVVVFASRKSHSEKYYAFGYGFPFIVVAITALSRPMYYGRDDVCWLSVEKGTIWGFMAPVAAILILNTAALILAQYKASKISVKDDKVALFARWLRVTLILFPVLGITWLFGFLYLGRYFEIAGYLFAIFNSFQGVCIFVCHCVMDKKARNMVVDSFKKKSTSITTGSSSSQKKMKGQPPNGVKSNSIVPVEIDNRAKRTQVFQFPNKRTYTDCFNWHKPWSFCFELPVSDENSSKKQESNPHAVIVHLNSLPEKNCV